MAIIGSLITFPAKGVGVRRSTAIWWHRCFANSPSLFCRRRQRWCFLTL